MMRLGFIGAGRMGSAMVRRLAGAGHEVRALGRSTEKCQAIRQLGADAVTDLVALTGTAEAVIVCVFTDEQVLEICLDTELPARMAPDSVLVLHTTGSPRTAEQLAARGIDVVDAPVSGGPQDIAAGRLTLFVGGSDAAVARVRPALASYGDPILHVGPTGAGQRVKLVNNALFAAQIGLITGAVRLGTRLGVTESTLLSALTHGSGASRALDSIARAGSADAFSTAVGDFLGKDIAVVRKVAAELGTDLNVLDGVLEHVTAAAPKP